jgi:putative nucleotidyltransferase with HDIG domain
MGATTMDRSQALKKLELIENLPTLPVIVQQIQKLIDNPKSNMSQIATVITRDQAIAARVVRLVNSAFYGFSNKISSIQQAIMLLGLNTVKNLVIGVSVVKTFEGIPGSTVFDRQNFWLHSFGCATCARLMAKSMNQQEPEDFFMAGLLHDIGILILDQFFHAEFVDIVQQVLKTKGELVLVESEVIGIDHCEVGAFIAEKWRIPEFLKTAIGHHHRPRFSQIETEYTLLIAAVVHVADAVVCQNGITPGFPCTISLNEEAVRKAGLNANTIVEIFETVKTEMKKVMADWGIR